MLKIRAVKIEINTTDGLYGADFEFGSGLNIIRGDNTAGKSSLFQSILYSLGFEELLGGKNEKTMQSVLKDQVEFPRNTFHKILQSFVYIEIENKEKVTFKRSVVSPTRKPQLIDVYFGALLTGDNKTLEHKQMFVHDSGGASDDNYGFHLFLADFLEVELPEVLNAKGELDKLFIQQLAPAFIIEQKTGWSDFFATMPYYGMRNTQQRVIELLLNLDVFENEKRKQYLISEKQSLNLRWSNVFYNLQSLAERTGGKLEGLENTPMIINDFNDLRIVLIHNGQNITLKDLNELQKQELLSIETESANFVGTNIVKNEADLKSLTEELNQTSLNFDLLSQELNFDRERLRSYSKQLKVVRDDLKKNKGALKLNKLGGDLPTKVANHICPTCEQKLEDSLLPTDIQQTPMRIEENVAYLNAQERMIELYIKGQNKVVREKEIALGAYQTSLEEIRHRIRSLKRELVQDERLPSIVEIERKIDLKRRIEFFNKVLVSFMNLLEDLKGLSKEYSKLLAQEGNLPKDFFSLLDKRKLGFLEDSFIGLLRNFNYQSKPFNAIRISLDTYFPVAQKVDAEQFYNIKFDSSASDFIRCIWAYTIALLKTSIYYNAKHPKLIIFDEPKQQDMSRDSFIRLLKELSNFKDQQVLLFASFENSDSSFKESTEGLTFNYNRIEELLIKPVKAGIA